MFDRGTCSSDVLQQIVRILRFLALRSQTVVLQRVEDVELLISEASFARL